MSRSRFLSTIAAASLGIALLGACSTESLTERAVSFGLEQAVEGDQDIDLDFGQDGSGGFSISTDEGDFALNFDEDNAGIVFNTDEGDGVISFDEDGIVFNTDEGDGVISFDDDSVSIQSDEGNFGLFSYEEAPDLWPVAVGQPSTLVPGSQEYTVLNFGDGTIVSTGAFEHAADEAFGSTVIAALINDGWTATDSVIDDHGIYGLLTKGDDTAQISTDAAGNSNITITAVTS